MPICRIAERCQLKSPLSETVFETVGQNRIALALAFPQYPSMLARVLSAAVNGIEAFPVEVEVNSSWGDTMIVMLSCHLPMPLVRPIARRARRSQSV
jgi:hypothetical protein